MITFDDIYSHNTNQLYYPEPSSVLINHMYLFEQMNDLKALDLGCGDGRNSIFLAENNFAVNSIDISVNAVKKLKNIIEQNKYAIYADVGDVTKIKYEDCTYDLIVASTIFDHLEWRESEKLIKDVKNGLKSKVMYMQEYLQRKIQHIVGKRILNHQKRRLVRHQNLSKRFLKKTS